MPTDHDLSPAAERFLTDLLAPWLPGDELERARVGLAGLLAAERKAVCGRTWHACAVILEANAREVRSRGNEPVRPIVAIVLEGQAKQFHELAALNEEGATDAH